jgi:hypothetical protein
MYHWNCVNVSDGIVIPSSDDFIVCTRYFFTQCLEE